MPSALIIPGVQVRTEFEPSPVLPGQTGILGVVGVVDRGPMLPTPVGNFGEFIEIFGAGSRYSLPEVRAAFANGVTKAVITRIEPGRGQKASLELIDDDGEKLATVRARAEGAWGNQLAVRVTQVKALSQKGVKFINLETLLNGAVIESFNGLVSDETSPNYIFDRINQQSRVIVAVDPLFETALPAAIARTALAEADARAAFTTLKAGAADVVRVDAKRAGRAGNQAAISVADGKASLLLKGAADAASLEIIAREAGSTGAGIRVTTSSAGPDSVSLTVTPVTGTPRPYGPFTKVDDLVNALKSDPDVSAETRGAALPTALAQTALSRRVSIDVLTEGRDTASYVNLPDLAAIAAISDPLVAFTLVEGATQIPDVNPGIGLTSGRNKGAALALVGDASAEPLLEIVPAQGARGKVEVSVSRGVSTVDNSTAAVTLSVFQDDELVETFNNLTMDPDDEGYLPQVLRDQSGVVRAADLFVRSRASSLPKHMVRAASLTGGTSPSADDYQGALDRLESADEVDLVIASVANQLSGADIRKVHAQVVAHCTKMADVARNRIGLGSVTTGEAGKVAEIIDHANDVRSDHFILTAPARAEAAVAGLLSRQDFFQSPTFKTIASLEDEPGHYTDAQLEQLITGNVAVINSRRTLGNIVVKGVLTSGRQINVQRTANKSVREVKAIADRYIGLLNNDGARNALRQQISAMFLQMERDGALVPSTDGKDPAFLVNVYSTQADFANGIVRVDIAVRPVRAIDYIYATILVKN